MPPFIFGIQSLLKVLEI